MLRTRILRTLVSDGIQEKCAVAFHAKWMEGALEKIMNKGVEDLEKAVKGVEVGAGVKLEGRHVSDDVETGEGFHRRWMEKVHRKVIQDVDNVLAEAVNEMKDEVVPFLMYPEADLLTNKKVPLQVGAESLPAAVSLWHPSAHLMTWRLGGQNERGTVIRDVTMDHLTLTRLPTKKAPWKLPLRFKTQPIPSMHISSFGFRPMHNTVPVSLRMMLINRKEESGEEAK
eukprot:TRINITY_DN471_c0_g2_i2.p1 TRINITY_DN471_c0_g2~~TRINITY_DN471_c0_g2_i2.p1  ORF type:complete len:227 (+),score=35.91 TRINITY_DN471_c0_g2_i2:830-1510(+)